MKIAYVYPPLFKPFYPMATRIMTENLLRNKNFEVQFSRIPHQHLHLKQGYGIVP